MSTTKHREVAKLDRVPLPIEAARIGATGWQVTRTGARVVTKLAGRGSLQQKVIREIPKTFADLGPTYVKFGQIIASSPGAFGEGLSREFRSLLDRVPPADPAEVHKLLVEDLGDDPKNLFKSFDDEPFASASIAQVHYATLHTGEEVVVKIQRPGIRRRVAARTSSPTSPTTSPKNWTSDSRRSRWTRGCRTCMRRRSAATSGCRRCTGT